MDDDIQYDESLIAKDEGFDFRDGMNIVVIILLIMAIAGMVYFSFKLTDETTKCVNNPIEYYNDLGKDKCYCLSGIGGEDSPMDNCPKVDCNRGRIELNATKLKEAGIIQ